LVSIKINRQSFGDYGRLFLFVDSEDNEKYQQKLKRRIVHACHLPSADRPRALNASFDEKANRLPFCSLKKV
jgi:hypothetical protein